MPSAAAARQRRSRESGTRASSRCGERQAACLQRPPAGQLSPGRRRPRAGRQPPAPSHAGAASPRTIAAVLATFASTHERAATVTVRQGVIGGKPDAGSRGDALAAVGRPAADGVLDVARPPRASATRGPGPSRGDGVVVGDRDAPAARGRRLRPRCRRRARRGLRRRWLRDRRAARSAAKAFAVAPRSSSTPSGTRSGCVPRRASTVRHSSGSVRSWLERPAAARGDERERPVVPALRSCAPSVGSTRPPCRGCGVERDLAAPRSKSGATATSRPAAAVESDELASRGGSGCTRGRSRRAPPRAVARARRGERRRRRPRPRSCREPGTRRGAFTIRPRRDDRPRCSAPAPAPCAGGAGVGGGLRAAARAAGPAAARRRPACTERVGSRGRLRDASARVGGARCERGEVPR